MGKRVSILIGVLLMVALLMKGCGGSVLPPEVYRVRNVLAAYYHALLRLNAHQARIHLVRGGASDSRFDTVFREFQAFRSRAVNRYDTTSVRIVRFDIEATGDTAFIRSFLVSYCDWNKDEAPPGFSWTGGSCPGQAGELLYSDYQGTACRIDGEHWLLD